MWWRRPSHRHAATHDGSATASPIGCRLSLLEALALGWIVVSADFGDAPSLVAKLAGIIIDIARMEMKIENYNKEISIMHYIMKMHIFIGKNDKAIEEKLNRIFQNIELK